LVRSLDLALAHRLRKHTPNMSETTDDIAARHRKEIKALEGEQRAAVKKTKTTAGKAKKAKEAVAAYVVVDE